MKYLTADLHLYDEEILKYRNLGIFGNTIEDYHRLVIANLKQLTPDDELYILGDITMTEGKEWEAVDLIKTYCDAHIFFVPGNHDNEKVIEYMLKSGGMCEVTMNGSFDLDLDCGRFICTHIPVHPDELQWYDANIHGHIHHPMYPLYIPFNSPNPIRVQNGRTTQPYINVNLEFNNFRFWSEYDIKLMCETRKAKGQL